MHFKRCSLNAHTRLTLILFDSSTCKSRLEWKRHVFFGNEPTHVLFFQWKTKHINTRMRCRVFMAWSARRKMKKDTWATRRAINENCRHFLSHLRGVCFASNKESKEQQLLHQLSSPFFHPRVMDMVRVTSCLVTFSPQSHSQQEQ